MPVAVNIRPSQADDWPQLWAILEPVIRAGDTYALPQAISEQDARTYWFQTGNEVFVAEIKRKSAVCGFSLPKRK